MPSNEPILITVSAESPTPGSTDIVWRWPGGGFVVGATAAQLHRLAEVSEDLRNGARTTRATVDEFGRTIGDLLVGQDNSRSLWEVLSRRRQEFALCAVSGAGSEIATLPWETLTLPEMSQPLMFCQELRGRFDFVRGYPASADPASRHDVIKFLVVSSRPNASGLLTDAESQRVRARMSHLRTVRFRWLQNPTVNDLQYRLNQECSLFQYAGHGRIGERRYLIEMESQEIEVSSLHDALRRSRAQMLIFDSCDSAVGSAASGLPALWNQLPNATALLGFWGQESDAVSAWYMPALAEDLVIGTPVWASVNQLRILLFEEENLAWFRLVVHLKHNYLPFDRLAGHRDHVAALMRDSGL